MQIIIVQPEIFQTIQKQDNKKLFETNRYKENYSHR